MRRPGADVVLAVVLPVVCALALLLLHPDRSQPGREAPVDAPLASALVVCPSALPGTESTGGAGITSLAGSDGAVDGEVTVGLGAATTPLRLRSGRVATPAAGDGSAFVVSGSGALAPGLLATRSASAPLAATDCAPPQPRAWFTGVGADATHDSVLELVNPDSGPAVADVTVLSPDGELDVPALRGVTVPGGSSATFDLGAIVPRRGDLALEVVTGRGRLAAQVVDRYDELGAGANTQDWLPGQAEPSSSNLLLGLVGGSGERTLVLANPGDDEVRAELQVVSPTATFAPSGVEPVRVPPGGTATVSLDDVLADATAQGATGLLVTSTGPVSAGLRQRVGGDLTLAAPTPSLHDTSAAVLPDGTARLLLAGPDAVGVATVSAYAAGGRQLDRQRVELSPGAGGDVALPAGTALVTVTAERTGVHAVALVSAADGSGAAAVALREPVLTSRVPAVRPGVP
ncbi:DUF5719 family protein [Nocardioides flavescens]|uniref:Uncharacterized protein n=1 Tax=Nocardioides flavescens TaxID=2691959 RepID=A0A6L7EW29_9ACTN|nr:DUF5719 family protein [Nocardioides flavescens]MXG89598.1 hypothetical protein [Nocardioides flavescens]